MKRLIYHRGSYQFRKNSSRIVGTVFQFEYQFWTNFELFTSSSSNLKLTRYVFLFPVPTWYFFTFRKFQNCFGPVVRYNWTFIIQRNLNPTIQFHLFGPSIRNWPSNFWPSTYISWDRPVSSLRTVQFWPLTMHYHALWPLSSPL